MSRILVPGDRTFAKGDASCERYWTVRDGRLLIAGDDGRLTMDLVATPDGGWKGRWLVHETKEIRLEPKATGRFWPPGSFLFSKREPPFKRQTACTSEKISDEGLR
jgi:hypothetical protein